MERGNPSGFSGDINVVVHAAEAFTIKAAEAQLQRELLQTISSSDIGMKTVGLEGYGEILRKVFKGANLPEDAIPSRLDLKETVAKDEKNAKDQAAAQQQGEQQHQQTESIQAELQGDAKSGNPVLAQV